MYQKKRGKVGFMITKNTRNILKIKGFETIRWHSLRAHHLKSLIFQAFHKKTPVKRKGSFNFSKSNKINNLQKQDIPKTTIIADTLKKCDAKCDAFWKNSQLFSPKFHIWLRKNVFYEINISYIIFAVFSQRLSNNLTAFQTHNE